MEDVIDINHENFDFWHVLSDATTNQEHMELCSKIPDAWSVPLSEYKAGTRKVVLEWLNEDKEHMKRGISAIKKKFKIKQEPNNAAS